MDFASFELHSGHKCLVCGTDRLQSYIDLTLVTSRTSQSNTPVLEKLRVIISSNKMSDAMILCTSCFNMVDRYDQLESQLHHIRAELNSKYIQTHGQEFEEQMENEVEVTKKDGTNENRESLSWQQQVVPVDLLHPVVKLTAGEDGQAESNHDTNYKLQGKPERKKRIESQKNLEALPVPEKRPRGRPRKDISSGQTTVPTPIQDDDTKDKPVYEYDATWPAFKGDERLRVGQIVNDEAMQNASLVCIYCNEKRVNSTDISRHVWNFHKPQVVTTSVPQEDGSQREHNFGMQLIKIASDSLALGRSFICIFCNGTFKFKSNLLQHFRENHSPNKPFPCIECKARFRRSIDVSRHRVYYCPNKKPTPGGHNIGKDFVLKKSD